MSNEAFIAEAPSDRVFIRDEHILVIDELEIKDPEVVELVKHRITANENVEELIEDLIKIGAKAALVFNANTGAETIKNAIETAQRDITQSAHTVSQLVEGELKKVNDKDGDLQKGIAASVEKLSKDLEVAFAGEDTPLRKALTKSLEALSENLTKNIKERLKDQKDGFEVLLDPSHPTSPLRSLLEKLDSLSTTVNEVQTAMSGDVIRQEIEGNAPIGGVKYEEQVVKALIMTCAKVLGIQLGLFAIANAVTQSLNFSQVTPTRLELWRRQRTPVSLQNNGLTRLKSLDEIAERRVLLGSASLLT